MSSHWTFQLAFLLALGCSEKPPEQVPVDTKKTPNGKKSDSLSDAKSGNSARKSGPSSDSSFDDSDSDTTEGAFIEAEYLFSVTAAGFDVCDGPITLRIDPQASEEDGGLISASGCVECGGKPIHFDKIFGSAGVSSSETAQPEVDDDRSVDVRDGVIAIPDAGSSVFTPSRPILPAFLSASPQTLKSINVTRQVRVKNSKRRESGSGEVTLKTLSFGESYRSDVLKGVESLPNTMTFETVVTGFDDVDRFRNVLFDRLFMAISLDPVAIPEIVLEADLAQALGDRSKKDDKPEPEACPGGAADETGGLLGSIKPMLKGLAGSSGGSGGGFFDSVISFFGSFIGLEIKFQLVSQAGLEVDESEDEDEKDENEDADENEDEEY